MKGEKKQGDGGAFQVLAEASLGLLFACVVRAVVVKGVDRPDMTGRCRKYPLKR
jgi:hypothetical protein